MDIPDTHTNAKPIIEGYSLEDEESLNHLTGDFVFKAEWDSEGVYFYQAYNHAIADWALSHQRLGGPHFNPSRMTWIKPSFAWVLYRAGYGRKNSQERILKIKLPHSTVAELLQECACKHGGGGSKGRVQWDPARDIMTSEDNGRQPRRMLRERAIQIGLSNRLSEKFVSSIISIEDVSNLAQMVGRAHGANGGQEAAVKQAMALVIPHLPRERPYLPRCKPDDLIRLCMLGTDPLPSAREGNSSPSSTDP
ncbi:hypothetical protein AB1Y20_019085 [Prymnesium parvum]|uniref:DUF4291 domain-containing protein n=1 Tax=Prymnesium parvum TaxID=97485 RepID=A0AB34JU63_PRYPA|mmetsp:Transcript_5653/g.8658  ORF Transcript_5653/g.8658 Transcript_5653/m.8658 type:complete len:251 (-) Transcript_5653:71-823(-)